MSYEEEHTEALQVAEAMEIRGGGFVKALSACIRRADIENLQKIKDPWPEYWQQYKEHAARLRR